MFGFKIMPIGVYNMLKERLEKTERLCDERLDCIRKQKADLDDLRQELNRKQSSEKKLIAKLDDMIDELNKAKSAIDMGLSVLANFHILHECDYACNRCHLKSPDCRKLSFSDRTICVVPKDKVNSFVKNKPKK